MTPDQRWVRFLSSALPGDAGPVFVPPAAPFETLAPRAVAWFARAQDVPPEAGLWPAPFALVAAPGAVPGALACGTVGPTDAVLAEESAIVADSRSVSPGDPMPSESARVLFLLARARRSRSALELGTGDGAAALYLGSALVLGHGRLVTVERDSARVIRARQHLRRAGLTEAVDLRLGEAERLVPRMDDRFDLVLLDADVAARADHLALVLPLCLRGALVVSRGAVAHAAALARYQATVRTHPAVRAEITVASGDGLAFALLA